MRAVDLSAYQASIKRDGERIGELATQGLSADVPPCPNWTVGDLTAHLVRVFTMVNRVLESNDHPGQLPTIMETSDLVGDYVAELRRLLANLDTTDPELERWNWSVGPQVAGFWWRRMAHEAAVHRWDAESAFGPGPPIDTDLAVDAIDEWFDVHLRSDLTDPDITGDVPGTIQVQCLDTPGAFWASLTDRQLVFDRAVAGSDVAVRGSASDLLLVLWGRLSPDAVDVVGDDAVLRSWLAVPDI